MGKKMCPRLRELAPAARGGVTQPRANFFGHTVQILNIKIWIYLKLFPEYYPSFSFSQADPHLAVHRVAVHVLPRLETRPHHLRTRARRGRRLAQTVAGCVCYTERGVLSVARFCYVFLCELRGPAWSAIV